MAEDREVVYAAGRVAASIQDFAGAERIGRILDRSTGSSDTRWASQALSAGLAFAQGRWASAKEALERTATEEPEWALEMRALLSLFEPLPVPEQELTARRDSLQAWEPEAYVETSFTDLFGAHAQSHQEFRLFLLAMLSARLGEFEEGAAFAEQIRGLSRSPDAQAFTYALSRSAQAHALLYQGDPQGALEILETMGYYPAFEYISASPFFSRALDRWIRGELLVEVGRSEDALAWFATLSEGWGEFLFSGPAHLRQGQIHADLGNADQAIAHFLRFEDLWTDADPELQPLVQEAREAREALQASGRPGPP